VRKGGSEAWVLQRTKKKEAEISTEEAKGTTKCSFVGFSPRSNPHPNWILFLPLLFYMCPSIIHPYTFHFLPHSTTLKYIFIRIAS